MVNAKKAVSPLIASILLIALTVSIGAMIIGWGRQYVEQQTSCLGLATVINDASVSIDTTTSTATLTISLQNTGSQNLKAKDVELVYYDSQGNRNTFTPTTGKSFIFQIGGNDREVLPPGDAGYLKVSDGTTTSDITISGISTCDGITDIEIVSRGCGVISNRYAISDCQ